MSPSVWQLAHAESPWLLLNSALFSMGRPWTTLRGSGLCIATAPISALVARFTIEIEFENRVSTYRRWRFSSRARPLGPPPLSVIWELSLGTNVLLSSAAVSNTPILDDPNAAT